MPNEQTILAAPSTYAIQKPQPIQVNAPLATQTAAMGSKPVNTQASDGGNAHREQMTHLMNVHQGNLRSMSGFSALAQEVLKENQDKEFAEGYMRSMQGESLDAIARDKPFFSLFGDSGAVRGARAQLTESKGQSVVQYIQQNRGDLEKMSLDDQRANVAAYVDSLKTGDEATDTQVAMGVMKVFPAIFDNLARSAENENQKQAAIHQADSIKSSADALAYAANEVATGRMAPEHYAALQVDMIKQMQPLPGQSPDSYRQSLTGTVAMLTKNGQFEMANLIQDKVLRGQLTDEENMQFDRQIKSAQNQWLMDNPESADFTSFQVQLPTQIDAGRYSSEADVYAKIDQVNLDYKIQTGSVTPLFNNEDKAKAGARWQQAALRNQASAAKLQQSEMDEFQKRAMWQEGAAKGSPAIMAASGLDAKGIYAQESNEFQKFFGDDANNASAITLGRRAVNGSVNAPLKEHLGRTLGVLKGGGIPKQEDLQSLQLTYMKFQNTPFGDGAASAYFGEDLALVKSMSGMDMSKRENQQWVREEAEALKKPVSPTQEMVTAANDLVDSDINPGWWRRTFGESQSMGAGFDLAFKDDMKREVANVMARFPNLTGEEALKIASGKVMQSRDVAGDMLITGGKKGDFFKNLNSHLNIKFTNPQDPRINNIIHESIKGKVPNQSDYTIGSLHQAGSGMLYATIVRDNGTTQSIVLSPEAMANTYNMSLQHKHADKQETRRGLAEQKKEYGAADGY